MKTWLCAASLALLTSCASVMSPVGGVLNLGVKGPVTTTGRIGNGMGMACASSILGIIAMGDASITSAANKGGIRKIGTVDHESTNYLGFYAKYCTIVHGASGN